MVKGCDHIYCAHCILHWALHKEQPWCPQCKQPFSYLLTYRALDGTLSDFPVEESVVLLKRATWFTDTLRPCERASSLLEDSILADDTAWHDYADEYDLAEDEEIEAFYFSSAAGRARILLGNRRFGQGGYIAGGRRHARPVRQQQQQQQQQASSASKKEKNKGLSKHVRVPDAPVVDCAKDGAGPSSSAAAAAGVFAVPAAAATAGASASASSSLSSSLPRRPLVGGRRSPSPSASPSIRTPNANGGLDKHHHYNHNYNHNQRVYGTSPSTSASMAEYMLGTSPGGGGAALYGSSPSGSGRRARRNARRQQQQQQYIGGDGNNEDDDAEPCGSGGTGGGVMTMTMPPLPPFSTSSSAAAAVAAAAISS